MPTQTNILEMLFKLYYSVEKNLATNRLYKVEFWYLEVRYIDFKKIQIDFRSDFQHPIEVATASLTLGYMKNGTIGGFRICKGLDTCVPNSHSQDVLDMEYARRRAFNT